jgi:HNH endonuclease
MALISVSPQKIRRAVLIANERQCFYCNGIANSVDHIIPLSRGGRHVFSNMIAACLPCNVSKGNGSLSSDLLAAAQRRAGALVEEIEALISRTHEEGSTAATPRRDNFVLHTNPVSFRLKPDVLNLLVEMAAQEGVTLTGMVEWLIVERAKAGRLVAPDWQPKPIRRGPKLRKVD